MIFSAGKAHNLAVNAVSQVMTKSACHSGRNKCYADRCQHDGICFPGSRRNLHRKLCCSDLSVSVAYFIWKGNKFSLCTGGNRKKICFPDLSSSSGSIRSSEKMFRRSGSQQLSDLFLAASGFGIYADSGDSFRHICGLCVCKAKYFAE